jgi:hypothetical protein
MDKAKEREIKKSLRDATTAFSLGSSLINRLSWDEWIDKIPFLKFREEWLVKILFPFGGAMVRFYVKKKIDGESVSVYLDCNNFLGSISSDLPPKPYWEIYPHDGDTLRVHMEDVDGLMEGIEDALDLLEIDACLKELAAKQAKNAEPIPPQA